MLFRSLITLLLLAAAASAGQDASHAGANGSGRITLEEAYDRALATDQSIRIAFLAVRKANLLPWSAITRVAPQIEASGGYNRGAATTDRGVLTGGTLTDRARSGAGSLDVTYRQTLVDLAVFPAYRLGKLSARAARLAHQFTIRETLFGVTSAYYEVLKQKRLVEVNEETLKLSTEQMELAEVRLNVGEVTRADVLRARVSVEASRRIWLESRNLLELDRNTLRNILNLTPEAPLEVIEPPAYSTNLPSFENLWQTAQARREDLLAKDVAVQEDIERKNTILAEYAPKVTGSASSGLNNTTGTTRSHRTDWELGIGITVPIFEGGQREIDLATAKYQIEQTRLDRDRAAKDVEAQVKQAWLDVHTLEGTLTALRAQVAAAEQGYRDLQTQYSSGSATSVDVLSALNDLDISRKDLAIQSYQYEVALRNLEEVTGVFQERRVRKSLLP